MAMTAGLALYRGKRVLVTGDTGFKGSWLALWLDALGARVTGFSLPPRTPGDNYVACGMEDIIGHVDGDIRNLRSVRSVFSERRPEVVFHLAAQALVLESYRDPVLTFHTNILGTANVLEAARHTPSVKSVVVVTSDKCYENREWLHGYREEDPMGGRDPYSASKGAAEIVTSSYLRSFYGGRGLASARAGNVLGGGDRARDRILPDCIRALRAGKPVVVRNPDAVRPWQHVLEPLRGYLMLGAGLLREPARYAGPWNFGPVHGNMVTVRRLVEEVLLHWGAGRYAVRKREGARESRLLHLDISKAVHALGWKPVLDIGRTVKWTVEEYRAGGTPRQVRAQRIRRIREYMKLAGARHA